MFSFLFKRKEAKAKAELAAKVVAQAVVNPPTDGREQANKGQKKQEAMQQAASFVGNEQGALSFILQCEFADARLQAAQEIQSHAALTQVFAALRNTDRRVAKLMQQRLEALQFQQQSTSRAQEALAFAEKLLASPQLLTNQLTELDSKWQALGKLPSDMPQVAQFSQLRAAIAQRLQAQAQLQRLFIDLNAKLKTCLLAEVPGALHGAETSGENNVENHAENSVEKRAEQMRTARALLQEFSALKGHVECANLPRHLVPEAEQAAQRIMQEIQTFEQIQAGMLACQQALASWGQASAESVELAVIQQEWQGLLKQVPASAHVALQQQFAELKRRLTPTSAPVVSAEGTDAAVNVEGASESNNGAQADSSGNADTDSATYSANKLVNKLANKPAREKKHPAQSPAQQHFSQEEIQAATQQFAAALHALEVALEQGLLQAAFENDKILRDIKAVKPKPEQAGRLTGLRAELHRLQSWARWGGTVSREELTKSVEDLPQQELNVLELAKKVGSMRDRWRALDASAGSAPRPLWERFDQACTIAYAPAAEHFKKLAAERAEHAAHAAELIQQVQNFAASHLQSEQADKDWRAIASFCQKLEQQWHKMGSIERKERKRLDKEFAQAMEVLTGPLEQQRVIEVRRREELIAAVENLQAQDRGALDQLRQMQERWQEMAKALPLARKVEQELWQRFHTGCDQVFAQRKENAHQEQAERRQHQQDKEALLVQLEQVPADESAKNLRELMKTVRQGWKEIGAVPRQAEAAMEARFQQALDSVQQRIDAAQRAAQEQQANAQLDKLMLCISVESALLAGTATATDLSNLAERWAALPKLSQEMEKLLVARWQNALHALEDTEHCAKLCTQLRDKQVDFGNEVLRQEIIQGIDSPAEFSRERLQMQVQVLQSSLKSGVKAQEAQAKLPLYSMAAALDDAMLARLRKLIA